MAVDWKYYDKFDGISDKYLPEMGEGETKATQIVTAVSKLVYKWYNDGDVFDNTYYMMGWANDLSSYANWLYKNTTEKTKEILDEIEDCYNSSMYENLLKELTDELFNEGYLAEQDKIVKIGSIYECNGEFEFREYDEDEEDNWDEDWDEDNDEDEDDDE